MSNSYKSSNGANSYASLSQQSFRSLSTSISKSISNSENFIDTHWCNNGFQKMEEIRRMGKLCDITLVVNEHKFTAHRIVLASSIPYFHAMFLNEMIESKQDVITISTVDPNALEQFINYSYNGMITISNENVQSLLIGANFFHLKNIKNACVEFIKKRLTVQDALYIRMFADQIMCHDLITCCNRFIDKNFSKIAPTEAFLELNSVDLMEILKRDELNVDCEEQVYEALLGWIKYDAESRKEHLHELLKQIRLPLVAPTYLFETIKNNELIKNNLVARDLLDEACYFHLLPEKRNQLKTFKLKPRCCCDSFGLIYAIGGVNNTGGSVSTVEVYDCISNTWRVVESMITSRSRVAIAVLQGKLFAIGGYNGLERLSTVEIFEPELKKWKRVSPISKPRSALGSAVLNNRLYVCGGYDGFQSSDTVEVYNPKTDKWTIASSMRKHRSASGIAAFNSMIYAAGGHDGYRIFDSVECYDTLKDEWTFVSPMNTKRCRLGLSGLNQKLYAAGGYDSLNFLSSVEAYDPITDKWELVASMNVKRSRMALVTCNGRLYAFGGYDGVCNLSSVEFYDPDANQWTMVSPMTAHEGVVGVGVLPIEAESQDNSNQEKEQQQIHQQHQQLKTQPKNIPHIGFPNTNKPPVLQNHYTLMEEEEEENQYQSMITPNNLQPQNTH